MPNILIIEDDAAFCQMLQKFLIKQGYEVHCSFTAPDAKLKCRNIDFDLVLTDLRLPDYDGIQMLVDIKKSNPNTTVVVMTGYAEVSTAVAAMKKGAFDYIAKPFTPDEMLEVISKALNSRAAIVSENVAVAKSKAVAALEGQGVIRGISEASKKLNEYIQLVSPTKYVGTNHRRKWYRQGGYRKGNS